MAIVRREGLETDVPYGVPARYMDTEANCWPGCLFIKVRGLHPGDFPIIDTNKEAIFIVDGTIMRRVSLIGLSAYTCYWYEDDGIG